jgi:hypothetical protein
VLWLKVLLMKTAHFENDYIGSPCIRTVVSSACIGSAFLGNACVWNACVDSVCVGSACVGKTCVVSA